MDKKRQHQQNHDIETSKAERKIYLEKKKKGKDYENTRSGCSLNVIEAVNPPKDEGCRGRNEEFFEKGRK